jgi:DNA-directed RNA polymerase subunit RPC12/RpoP
MTIDTRTIAELEKDGFTHIDARCAGCGRIVQMPFKLLLTRERIAKATTIAELRRRYRCQNCGSSHAARFRPVATRGQHGLTDLPGRKAVLDLWEISS